MNSDLIINTKKNYYRIALLKNEELIGYHIDKSNNKKFNIGDIYLGKIKKIIPGLNAAFIDIGYEKDAFLHYLDLGIQFNYLKKFTKVISKSIGKNDENLTSIKNKTKKINNLINKGDKILVQIIKEPILNKGPRLSCEISITGKYIILIPFNNSVNISRKINNVLEKKRLIKIIEYIKPKNFGIVIRTAAELKEISLLNNDLKNLLKIWKLGIKKLQITSTKKKIIGESEKISYILKEIINEPFKNIIIDDEKKYKNIKKYISNIDPEKKNILKLYKGEKKIFEQFKIEKHIKSLFGKSVNINGGGYIIIEHTEAMHVIDVNSGNKTTINENQELTSLSVNISAAKEISRQLKLRDIGGIIVIDFIDMKILENKQYLYQKMKKYTRKDKSKITIIPLSKFGIMQITRQRIKPEINITTKEKCPRCKGFGIINPSILISDKIEKKINFFLKSKKENKITIFIHPYIYSYFTKGIISKKIKWILKHKKWIKLIEDSSLEMTELKIFDKKIKI